MQNSDSYTCGSRSERETVECGRTIAGHLKPGALVGLIGTLGSGKTTLIKGIAKGLGIADKKTVKSPTFVIMHVYQGRIPLYHFDLYRLDSEDDLEAIGANEFFNDRAAICVVEWADRIPGLMSQLDFKIEIAVDSENERTIRFRK